LRGGRTRFAEWDIFVGGWEGDGKFLEVVQRPVGCLFSGELVVWEQMRKVCLRVLGCVPLRIELVGTVFGWGIVGAIVQVAEEEDVALCGEESIVVGWRLLVGSRKGFLVGEAIWRVIAVDEDEVPDEILPVLVPRGDVAFHGRKMGGGEGQVEGLV